MKKRLDDRINHLIGSGIQQGYRSLFALLGLQVEINLSTLIQIYAQKCLHVPKLLWCYNDKPKFQQTRKKSQQENATFLDQQDSDQVLGQTFSILILQDFNSLTPNTLAKCVETVRGGEVQSLQDLQFAKMDVHKRYQTKSKQFDNITCVNRFTERFLKILETCDRFLALDQSLDVLEISDSIKEMKNMIGIKNYQHDSSADKAELTNLQQIAIDSGDPIKSSLSKIACTVDQCQILMNLLDIFQSAKQGVNVELKQVQQEEDDESSSESEDIIQSTQRKPSKDEKKFDKKLNKLQKHNKKGYNQLMKDLELNKVKPEAETNNSAFPSKKTIFIKAARGRGKSALIGLSLGAAISQQATNILVFAPNSSNIQTLFEFAIKSIQQLGYQEHIDYTIRKQSGLDLSDIIGIDIFKTHKQSIRYIDLDNAENTSILQLADLIIVDEGAAMPVTIMNKILVADCFIIISSTVHGYEGSGRALMLKVLQKVQNRKQHGCDLIQYDLKTPIRYNSGDRIEQWLYNLLLLDCESLLESFIKSNQTSFPPLEQTQLYQISRDALFSGEQTSEMFLKLIWSIFVSSHYKNQPNDLQLLSDSPTQRLFVLLGPITNSVNLPIPICVIQASIEGNLPINEVEKSLNKQIREDGNMVPWLLAQQFQQPNLTEKTTLRIVRIAINSYYQKHGYGTRALNEIQRFYSENIVISKLSNRVDREMKQNSESTQLPPLLIKLNSVKPEPIDYISVAFGLNQSLFNFYQKLNFIPLYIKLSKSAETGENSILMVQNFNSLLFFTPLNQDFTKRFFRLASTHFKDISCDLVFKIINSCSFEHKKFDFNQFSGTDFSRIQAFVERKIEFNSINDLVQNFAEQVFLYGNCDVLTTFQQRVFCAICVQKRTFSDVARELKIPSDQAQAIFCKGVEGVYQELKKGENQQNCFEKKIK